MKVIVGLGNFKRKYSKTKHNVGFWFVDSLAENINAKWKNLKDYQRAEGEIGGEAVALIKPMTFMNSSGPVVKKVLAKNNIFSQDLILAFDDVNLDVGTFRVRLDGSSGGHNGVKSVIENIAEDNFVRVRIGIGPKPEDNAKHNPINDDDLAGFVLSKFKQSDEKKVRQVVDKAVEFMLGSIGQKDFEQVTIHI